VYWVKFSAVLFAALLLGSLLCSVAVADVEDITLPEDGQAYFTSVIVPPSWETNPRAKEIVGWFDQDVRLKSLKSQTHFRVYPTNDPIYRANLAHAVGNTPAVLVQKASGEVEMAVWEGGQLPATSNEMGNKVGRIFGKHRGGGGCPDGKCPLPKPTPDETQPKPEPVPDLPPKPVVPIVEPVDPVGPEGSNVGFWVLLAVLLVMTLGAANIYYFKQELKKS
jgi:hypothetical protein